MERARAGCLVTITLVQDSFLPQKDRPLLCKQSKADVVLPWWRRLSGTTACWHSTPPTEESATLCISSFSFLL
eukprot:scaffold2005_cov115-Skeletonema_dohrnii-CCMP3373.AAC.3